MDGMGERERPRVPFEQFAHTILPIRDLSAPSIIVAHAFIPGVDLNNTQRPTALVGLRGDTNPFDKP